MGAARTRLVRVSRVVGPSGMVSAGSFQYRHTSPAACGPGGVGQRHSVVVPSVFRLG